MKDNKPKRHFLSGIVIGLGAAYFWAVLMFSFYAVHEGWFGFGVLMVAGYAVAIASWFVIPIGASLGAILPRILANRARGEAICLGAFAGVICGLAAAVFTAGMELWPNITGKAQIVDSSAWMRHELTRFTKHAVSMGFVSSLCFAGWAYTLIKKAEQGGAPNAHPRHASCLSLRSSTSRATGERG